MTDVIKAMEDPRLFGDTFKNKESWEPWKAFLKAMFNLRMTKAELDLFRQCTDMKQPSDEKIREAWVIVGRRGGKSSIAALLAVWLACFKDWTPYVRPGERPYIFVISTKLQAQTVKDYVLGMLESKPYLSKKIEIDRQFEIDLKNHVRISCQPCSYRALRGKTVVCAILEEVCYWRWEEEAAVQDKEVVRALRPSMKNIKESLLIAISTPYVAQGIMAESFNENYGKPSSTLCWKAPTRTMNPSYPQEEIDKEYERDPESAASEFGAEWRSDAAGAVPPEVVDAVAVPKRFELPYQSKNKYVGAVDPSGGRRDSFTMSIAHSEDGKVVMDVLKETRPGFRPETVVEEYAKVFKDYDISEIQSDRYAGEWVVSAFADHGIIVESAKMTKSEFYLETIPLLINGSVELLDIPRLKSQFKSLERRTRAGGRDIVDNFIKGGHDDCANVCSIACTMIAQKSAITKGKIFLPNRKRKKAKKIVKTEKMEKPPKDFGEMIAPDVSRLQKGFLAGVEKPRPERKKKKRHGGRGVIFIPGG